MTKDRLSDGQSHGLRPRIIPVLWAFLRRDTKTAVSYRLQTFFHLAALFSMAVTFFFLSLMMQEVEGSIESLDRYGGSYFGFALIGLAVSVYMDSSLRSFSNGIRSAQITGTFEAMLQTPASVGLLMSGSALYTLLYTSLRSLTLVAMGFWVFGVDMRLSSMAGMGLVFALTAAATMSLGIFSAGFIVLFNRGDPVTAAISGLSWLLSGVIYPREILPGWVQEVSELLPMTHSLEATRLLLLRGHGLEEVWPSVIGLTVFTTIALPISLGWFAWSVQRAKVAGSLARY